jgi:hypothetical protein
VFVAGRLEGRGLGSGVEVDVPFWMLTCFRDGLASQSRAYLDCAKALRAAGLAE